MKKLSQLLVLAISLQASAQTTPQWSATFLERTCEQIDSGRKLSNDQAFELKTNSEQQQISFSQNGSEFEIRLAKNKFNAIFGKDAFVMQTRLKTLQFDQQNRPTEQAGFRKIISDRETTNANTSSAVVSQTLSYPDVSSVAIHRYINGEKSFPIVVHTEAEGDRQKRISTFNYDGKFTLDKYVFQTGAETCIETSVSRERAQKKFNKDLITKTRKFEKSLDQTEIAKVDLDKCLSAQTQNCEAEQKNFEQAADNRDKTWDTLITAFSVPSKKPVGGGSAPSTGGGSNPNKYECFYDSDCPMNHYCSRKQCIRAGNKAGPGASCTSNYDCASNMCASNKCW